MNCRKFEKHLDSYIAGTLGNRLMRTMTRHLDSCLSCCMLIKQEKELVAALGGLKSEIQPDEILWGHLEAQIDSSTRLPAVGTVFSFFKRHLAVVAVSLSLFIAGILFGALFLNPSAWGKFINPDNMASAAIARNFSMAENTYSQAKNRLLRSLEKNRETLDNETIKTVEKNLRLIDDAISEMKTVILEHPADSQNMLRLADLYKDEIRYLLKTNSILTDIN